MLEYIDIYHEQTEMFYVFTMFLFFLEKYFNKMCILFLKIFQCKASSVMYMHFAVF
jgi:hypothetical protein